MPSVSLTQEIRTKLDAGRLPAILVRRFLAGNGSARECCCCGRPIRAHEIEYTVDVPGVHKPYPMHIPCYHTWVAVLQELRATDAEARESGGNTGGC